MKMRVEHIKKFPQKKTNSCFPSLSNSRRTTVDDDDDDEDSRNRVRRTHNSFLNYSNPPSAWRSELFRYIKVNIAVRTPILCKSTNHIIIHTVFAKGPTLNPNLETSYLQSYIIHSIKTHMFKINLESLQYGSILLECIVLKARDIMVFE